VEEERRKKERLEHPYDVITREIKSFQNYFSVRRRPSEIILFQRVETCLELFHRLIAYV